jgi:anti-sigma B factor antagonist
MLNITKKTENGKLTLALEGRLDTVTAPELEKEVKESLDGVNELEMDCSKLDYISSAGLRVLLSAHKVMTSKGGMKVTHVNEIVAEVFDVTGFADILNIE